MAKELDVYRDWLGITEADRPLNYYQLLRLTSFCDDTARIRTHYRKMNSHVRKYATGDYAKQSQALLNELAKAMLCLTDAQRKREYDATLGREDAGEGKRRTLEEILLAAKAIDRDQLTKARSYADAVGLEIRDALVQQKMVAPDVITLAYAESIGLPYVELEDIGVDARLVPQIPSTMARQHSCVPVMIDENQLLVASPNPLAPDVEEELRLRFDMPVRTVLCTASGVNAVIAEHYPRDGIAGAPVGATAKQAAAEPEKEPSSLSPEEMSKRQKLATLFAFCLTIPVWMIFRTLTGTLGGLDVVIALVLGAVVAAVAFVVAPKV